MADAVTLEVVSVGAKVSYPARCRAVLMRPAAPETWVPLATRVRTWLGGWLAVVVVVVRGTTVVGVVVVVFTTEATLTGVAVVLTVFGVRTRTAMTIPIAMSDK